MAGAGQVGWRWRCSGGRSVIFAAANPRLRAIIPGFLGIGEPLIYGVTLPRMKPFVTACTGGACGRFRRTDRLVGCRSA